jgi:hypothetical protein
MAKLNRHKNGHPNFLHLGEVLHNMEEGVVAAYDWLTGPPMSEKERAQQRLHETDGLRRTGGYGL